METVPPISYLRGGAIDHAQNLRARALIRSEDSVNISDRISIVQASIRAFATARSHRFLDQTGTVDTVDYEPLPATLIKI